MGIEDVGVRFITEGEAQFESTLKRADKAVDNFGKTATKSADQVQSKWGTMMNTLSSPEGMKFMIGIAGAAAGAMAAAGAAAKKLADGFMTYAFQVKDFGRIIGATPEEASKLIQVADDIRLSVGSMTVAMRSAINKGYRPTIDGLGQMSDAYLSIQDPIERSRWLVETFGRSGLEMAKLMELGSAKIKEMGDSIEGTGRLMTAEMIKNAQDYHDALDKLGEVGEDVALILGGELAPAITKVASGLTGILGDIPPVLKMFIAMQKAMEGGAANLWDVQAALVDYFLVTKNAADITQEFTKKVTEKTNADWLAQNAIIEERRALQYLTDTTNDAVNQTDNLGRSMSDMARAASQAAGIKSVEIALDFKAPDVASQMKNLIDSINWKEIGGAALTAFMENFAAQAAPLTDEQKKQVAAQIGAVDIALKVETGDISKWEGIAQIKELFKGIDPITSDAAKSLIDKINMMSPPDITAYLNNIIRLAAPDTTAAAATNTDTLDKNTQSLGTSFSTYQPNADDWKESMGFIGENANMAAEKVAFLNEKLAEIPSTITTEIIIATRNVTTPTPGKQSGGPMDQDTLYLVGEKGPELFVPDRSGYLIPNHRLTIIPMASGGKMTGEEEKRLVRREKKRLKARKQTYGSNKTEKEEEEISVLEQGGDVLSAIRARETIAWDMVKAGVAEYNMLIKAGVSSGEMTDKKRVIDQQVKEAQALTKLRIESERQVNLLKSQADTSEGMEDTSTWLGKLIEQFKDFFDLLTSSVAKDAMGILNPLVSASPAPLAIGLAQIKHQMEALSASSMPRFAESVAQIANPRQIYNQSAVYNVSVPVTATIRSEADIQSLAYQIAKVFVRETR